jgi:hypothetical protein
MNGRMVRDGRTCWAVTCELHRVSAIPACNSRRSCDPVPETKAGLVEVMVLAPFGRISAHVERFSLTAAQAAYDKLRADQLNGRAVVLLAAA